MTAILISQGVFSIRLIHHVKKDAVFSNGEKKLSKVVNVTAMVLSCLLAITVIYKTPVMLKQTYYLQIITNVVTVVAVAAGIYLGVMHNKLKRFITSRYFASVDTIGNELEEQEQNS
ncbi:MAG TPA: hypothetical protein VG738_04390 [Chitinophagaceae bacterium]|nr:hypothetical protein [Chitinophagaceae bacterium]